MATYTVAAATSAWQTAPTVGADAWFQPTGGNVLVSTDASPDEEKAGVVQSGQAYPVSSGVALKYKAAGAPGVKVRMWDKT